MQIIQQYLHDPCALCSRVRIKLPCNHSRLQPLRAYRPLMRSRPASPSSTLSKSVLSHGYRARTVRLSLSLFSAHAHRHTRVFRSNNFTPSCSRMMLRCGAVNAQITVPRISPRGRAALRRTGQMGGWLFVSIQDKVPSQINTVRCNIGENGYGQ